LAGCHTLRQLEIDDVFAATFTPPSAMTARNARP
jgi:hypothetical protein